MVLWDFDFFYFMILCIVFIFNLLLPIFQSLGQIPCIANQLPSISINYILLCYDVDIKGVNLKRNVVETNLL